ncbi:MAG: pyrimidine-nucleoside phosphorylase [Wujia sp.]
MRMYDIINCKKYGNELTREQIEFVVDGFTRGDIPDYQMSALLMAIYCNGMTAEETKELTLAMTHSGETLDLSAIEGVKVDKHSTGGVGDKTTFIVAPILASLGVPIAKMSGRGLGHTGGTIDKLESIKGFDVALSKERFIDSVNKIKLSLVGQTGNLAPADKKIYALRDVTATVDSIPLIASSIMSKKIAAGADAIVLDVKCGSGAFMKTRADAEALAKTMVNIGNLAGKRTYAVITDMNEPLGCKVGNALEVEEAVDVLKLKSLDRLDRGIDRLVQVSLALASNMLMAADASYDYDSAKEKCKYAITSGNAFDKLREFVINQGGDGACIDNTKLLPQAKYVIPVVMDRAGYVESCNTSEVGMTSLILGGGRVTKESELDLAVGIDIRKHIGDYVDSDEVFAYIYANDESKAEEAVKRFKGAYTLSDEKPVINEVVSFL